MLTDTEIRGLKPRKKPYKKADGRGLYVLVRPNGARWWRLKYTFRGREKLLSLTAEGRQLYSRAGRKWQQAQDAVIRKLGRKTSKQMMKMNEALVALRD